MNGPIGSGAAPNAEGEHARRDGLVEVMSRRRLMAAGALRPRTFGSPRWAGMAHLVSGFTLSLRYLRAPHYLTDTRVVKMARTNLYRYFCPIARSLELVGEKWNPSHRPHPPHRKDRSASTISSGSSGASRPSRSPAASVSSVGRPHHSRPLAGMAKSLCAQAGGRDLGPVLTALTAGRSRHEVRAPRPEKRSSPSPSHALSGGTSCPPVKLIGRTCDGRADRPAGAAGRRSTPGGPSAMAAAMLARSVVRTGRRSLARGDLAAARALAGPSSFTRRAMRYPR